MYSVIFPVAGEISAILFSRDSVNHTLPSGPAVIASAIGPTMARVVYIPIVVEFGDEVAILVVAVELGAVDVLFVEVAVCDVVEVQEVTDIIIISKIQHANTIFLIILTICCFKSLP